MQTTSRSSRRAFVLGSAAAAACLGPLAVAQLAGTPPPAPQEPAPPAPSLSEVAAWEGMVGASFLIDGAIARLAVIERPAIDPVRPAGLARFQPFTAGFEMEARLAPIGQRTYAVAQPAGGPIDLFLGRGEDRQGKTTLYALFN